MDIAKRNINDVVQTINQLPYHPKELINHPNYRCCDIYDGLASHFYGLHVHPNLDSADRRVLKHAFTLSKFN